MNTAPTLAQQLLLVDEIMRAGKGMGGSKMEQWCKNLILFDVNVLYLLLSESLFYYFKDNFNFKSEHNLRWAV